MCESCCVRLTNPLWYLAAFVLALSGAMAGTAVAASAFDPVRDATVVPVTERVDAKGSTLAIYTDLVQDDRVISCRGRYGEGDRGRVVIPGKGIDVTAQGDGTTWHLVGLLEQGRDGLRIVCTPTDDRVDNAAYGYATVTGYGSAVNNGKGIASIGAGLGAVLAAWVFWSRRQARREARLDAGVAGSR
jgi:hypothetical protein